MSKELCCPLGITGLTITATLYLNGVQTAAGIACPETGVSGNYFGNMTGAAGSYTVVFKNGSAQVGAGTIAWDGTQEVTLQTLNTLLAATTITVVSPLSADGATLTLTTGDSYTVANGQSLKFNIANQPGLVGATAHLRLAGDANDLAVSPAIVLATQQVVFSDVPVSATVNLTPGKKHYQIRFLKGGDVATAIQGLALVQAGL